MRTTATALLLWLTILLLTVPPVPAEPTPPRGSVDQRAHNGARNGLTATIAFIDAHPEIFPVKKTPSTHLPDRQQRISIRQTWQIFLDHILYLDAVGRSCSELYRSGAGRPEKGEAFIHAYAAFLTQYRFALDFIERIERTPELQVILNEPAPESGLAGNSYADFKFRFLNIGRGAEFARLQVIYEHYRKENSNLFLETIHEDSTRLWQAGKGVGPDLTLKNAFKVVGDLGFTTWFPVQKEVAKTMGNLKIRRQERNLISPAQIKSLVKKLRPGDILLERREWYASNVGIPGYWPHAALYIGTPAERRQYFSDPALTTWIRELGSGDGDLEGLLKKRNPEQYLLATADQEGHHPRVIEAIEEGVTFTTLEHSAAADSLAVLRPRLPARSKALAVIRALQYGGRPYDFNFDFLTDSQLVCSELVYKAYEAGPGSAGLTLPVANLLGRKIVSPNDLARLFTVEYGTPKAQFELITFLDGHERQGQAVEADVTAFLASWQRPKWHIWLQEEVRQGGK